MTALIHSQVMSDSSAYQPFPRAPLIGAGALIGITLLTVTIARLTGFDPREPLAPTVVARELRFEDRPDGGIAIYAGRSERTVDVVPPGSGGFLRATLRSLARERKSRAIGANIPFRLARRADGGLTLEDPLTGREIYLQAFGATNAGVFARLLKTKGDPP